MVSMACAAHHVALGGSNLSSFSFLGVDAAAGSESQWEVVKRKWNGCQVVAQRAGGRGCWGEGSRGERNWGQDWSGSGMSCRDYGSKEEREGESETFGSIRGSESGVNNRGRGAYVLRKAVETKLHQEAFEMLNEETGDEVIVWGVENNEHLVEPVAEDLKWKPIAMASAGDLSEEGWYKAMALSMDGASGAFSVKGVRQGVLYNDDGDEDDGEEGDFYKPDLDTGLDNTFVTGDDFELSWSPAGHLLTPILEGQNCIILDQPGSDKSFAYVAPLVQKLPTEEGMGNIKQLTRKPLIHAVQDLNVCRVFSRAGPVRVGVTARGVDSTCSLSEGSGLGFKGSRGFCSRRRCLPGLSFSGVLEDVTPVSLENVSLEELLEQVGAHEPRDARAMVQIESNPHPSLLRRYSELEKPFERGRTLPIPMPHKLSRPFPLPLSRRALLPDAALSSSVLHRDPKPSPSPRVVPLSYPRLLSKILVVPNDEVRMVLESWKGRNRCKSGAIANLMLQLGRRDSASKALQLFAWVREQPRLWPDESILLSIIQVVLESRKLTLANKFLLIYKPLSVDGALVVANLYVQQGFIKDALRILTSLEERGVSGDSALYAKMIVKAGQAGAIDLVQDLVIGRDFNLEDCTRVMTICSRLGLDEEVEALFERYLQREFKPNIVMLTALMQARARAGKARQAVALFWELEEAGVKPDLIACRVMIRLCEKVGDVSKAVRVYNQMRVSGFVPTSDIYNVMIRLYCKEGRLAKAKEVIREMEMWGCAPTLATNGHLFLAGYKLS